MNKCKKCEKLKKESNENWKVMCPEHAMNEVKNMLEEDE